jgi:hypothetical protein
MSNLVTDAGERAAVMRFRAVSQDAVAAAIRFSWNRNTGSTTPTTDTPEELNQLGPASVVAARHSYGADPTVSGNPLIIFGSSIHNTQIRSLSRQFTAHPRGPIIVNPSEQGGVSQLSSAGGYQSNSIHHTWAEPDYPPARANRRRSSSRARGFWFVGCDAMGCNAATARPVVPVGSTSFVAYTREDFATARSRWDGLAVIRNEGGGVDVFVLARPVWSRSQAASTLASTGVSWPAVPVWSRSQAAQTLGSAGATHSAQPVWSRSQAAPAAVVFGSSVPASPVWSRSQAAPTLASTGSTLPVQPVWSRSEVPATLAGIGSQIAARPVWSRSEAAATLVRTDSLVAARPVWSRSQAASTLASGGATVFASPVWSRSQAASTLASTGASILSIPSWSRSQVMPHFVNTPGGGGVTVLAGSIWSRSQATVTYGSPNGDGTTRAVIYIG